MPNTVKPSKDGQRLLNFAKSGEISPNLVTLLAAKQLLHFSFHYLSIFVLSCRQIRLGRWRRLPLGESLTAFRQLSWSQT